MSSYSERPRNFPFLGWVKQQRCCVAVDLGSDIYCWRGGCVEADHAGLEIGLGMKCADEEVIPMCPTHHRHKTDGTGYFADWGAERVRAWLDGHIARIRDFWDRIQAAGPLPF